MDPSVVQDKGWLPITFSPNRLLSLWKQVSHVRGIFPTLSLASSWVLSHNKHRWINKCINEFRKPALESMKGSEDAQGLGCTWGTAGPRHRKSIRTRVSRKGLRGLGLKLDKWIKFMWVQRNEQVLSSNHELKIKTSYWWENEGMPWTWQSRLAMPTCYIEKGAFFLRMPAVPRISANHQDGGWKEAGMCGIWAAWTTTWLRHLCDEFILPTCFPLSDQEADSGDSTDRMNLGHKPAPGVPATHRGFPLKLR